MFKLPQASPRFPKASPRFPKASPNHSKSYSKSVKSYWGWTATSGRSHPQNHSSLILSGSWEECFSMILRILRASSSQATWPSTPAHAFYQNEDAGVIFFKVATAVAMAVVFVLCAIRDGATPRHGRGAPRTIKLCSIYKCCFSFVLSNVSTFVESLNRQRCSTERFKGPTDVRCMSLSSFWIEKTKWKRQGNCPTGPAVEPYSQGPAIWYWGCRNSSTNNVKSMHKLSSKNVCKILQKSLNTKDEHLRKDHLWNRCGNVLIKNATQNDRLVDSARANVKKQANKYISN